MAAITLPARCDRAAADALLLDLLAAQGPGKIGIDGSRVEQIGQAMFQLLLSARQSGGGASITPSLAMAETARMAGLSAELFEGGLA